MTQSEFCRTANLKLGRNGDLVVQELRCKVCPVWPRKGVNLRVDLELDEEVRILERLEHLAVEFVGQINLAVGPVVELDPHDKVANVAGVSYSNHPFYSRGAII